MRSRLAIWLCVAVLLGSAAWAAPAPPGPPVSVSVDGMPAPLSVPPVEKDGQWMAPSPDIFKYLGAVANYDNLTRTVKAIRGKTVILMKVGSTTARVNLKPQMLEVAPFLSGDRVMVPLRFVAATLGAQVAYDAPSRVIHLKTGKSTAVVVPPPPAPSPTPTPAPTPAPVQTGGPPAIREFYHNAQGALKPGDSLVVTLLGTPNGKASFFIEGVVEDVPLRESSPGTYSADYRFAGTGRIRGAKLYGTLMVGKDRAPLAVAAAPITVEPPRPHVQQAEPAPNSATSVSTPRIAGFFEPAGGILDPKTVVIRVNGTDVTSKAYVTQKFFTYTPQTPLPAGKVRVDVEARLTGAEPLQDTWQFDIQSGVSIASATHGAQAVYGPGETITVTMMGTSGGKATYDLGSYRVGLPMRETGTPGNYVGTYNVTSSDRADNIPIVVHLQVGTFPTATSQAPVPVTLGKGVAAPSKDVTLTVTAPKAMEAVGQDIEVKGQTLAGATVSVTFTSRVPRVGDVALKRETGTADPTGKFTVKLHLPTAPPSLPGVTYAVVVVATDANGRTGAPVAVPVQGP